MGLVAGRAYCGGVNVFHTYESIEDEEQGGCGEDEHRLESTREEANNY